MLNWLQKLFPLPTDLKEGQTVHVLGTGPVRVTDPCPRGPHSTVFEAVKDGDEQPMVYWRDEIRR